MGERIPKLARADFARVMERVLQDNDVRRAWAVVATNKGGGPRTIIRVTRRLKHDGRCSRGELLVVYGSPNAAERLKCKSYLKRHEPFPDMFVLYWPNGVKPGAGIGKAQAKRIKTAKKARAAWKARDAKPGAVAYLALTALDKLAAALADKGHTWTAAQRKAYERATAQLEPLVGGDA